MHEKHLTFPCDLARPRQDHSCSRHGLSSAWTSVWNVFGALKADFEPDEKRAHVTSCLSIAFEAPRACTTVIQYRAYICDSAKGGLQSLSPSSSWPFSNPITSLRECGWMNFWGQMTDVNLLDILRRRLGKLSPQSPPSLGLGRVSMDATIMHWLASTHMWEKQESRCFRTRVPLQRSVHTLSLRIS